MTLPAGEAGMLVSASMSYLPHTSTADDLANSRREYVDKLYGRWLGLCVANWTRLGTETDKIGGKGPSVDSHTRSDRGTPAQRNTQCLDTFQAKAEKGVLIIDRVVQE